METSELATALLRTLAPHSALKRQDWVRLSARALSSDPTVDLEARLDRQVDLLRLNKAVRRPRKGGKEQRGHYCITDAGRTLGGVRAARSGTEPRSYAGAQGRPVSAKNPATPLAWPPSVAVRTALGTLYRRPHPPRSQRRNDPSELDLEARDRATAVHHEILDAIANILHGRGWVARTPNSRHLAYDLAAQRNDAEGADVVLFEAKSFAEVNASQTFRHGLGQVLEYQVLLCRQLSVAVKAALVISATRESATVGRWRAVCASVGVTLLRANELTTGIPVLLTSSGNSG